MRWIALFSQTGSEIVEISEKLNCWPDIVFTNNKDKNSIHKDLRRRSILRIDTHNGILKDIEREASMWGSPMITLHGYLRIMPDLPYEVYNGHPGDIVNYPELRGKDPQKKALGLNLPSTGCIIHEVTPEVDSGEIIKYEQYLMQGDEDLQILIARLKRISVNMWVDFLKEKLNGAAYNEDIRS